MSIPNPIVLLDARARYVHPAFQMSRASTKTVFDSSVRLVTVPVNALGWDHDPATGQGRGYLSEPEATNLCTSASDFTHADWGKLGVSISPNAAVAPDGTMTMDKIVEDASNGLHRTPMTISGITAPNNTVAGSIYAKAGERSRITFSIREDTTSVIEQMHVDVSDGSIISSSSGLLNYGSVHVGGGIYWLYLVAQFDSSFTSSRFQVELADPSGSLQYQGDGVSGLYLWGAQYEVGGRVTSLIDTTGATATRPRDVLQIPDMSIFPWWRAERGTVCIDCLVPNINNGGHVFSLDSIRVVGNPNGNIRLDGNLSIGSITIPPNAEHAYRIAVSWDGDEWVAASNGAIFGSGEFTSPISANVSLGIGCRPGFLVTTGFVRSTRAVYYPAPVSSADLQSLTAIQE